MCIVKRWHTFELCSAVYICSLLSALSASLSLDNVFCFKRSIRNKQSTEQKILHRLMDWESRQSFSSCWFWYFYCSSPSSQVTWFCWYWNPRPNSPPPGWRSHWRASSPFLSDLQQHLSRRFHFPHQESVRNIHIYRSLVLLFLSFTWMYTARRMVRKG